MSSPTPPSSNFATTTTTTTGGTTGASRPSFLSPTFRPGLFANKVVFCTGGAGSICSTQVRALVYLGANACIVGRNVEKTEAVARDIAGVRPGAKVLGIGGVDVRDFRALEGAVERCVEALGGRVDFVMWVLSSIISSFCTSHFCFFSWI